MPESLIQRVSSNTLTTTVSQAPNEPPISHRTPSVSEFRFKTIGQPPELLKRFSAADPELAYRSPSPSPPQDQRMATVTVSTQQHALSRPTLLQALGSVPSPQGFNVFDIGMANVAVSDNSQSTQNTASRPSSSASVTSPDPSHFGAASSVQTVPRLKTEYPSPHSPSIGAAPASPRLQLPSLGHNEDIPASAAMDLSPDFASRVSAAPGSSLNRTSTPVPRASALRVNTVSSRNPSQSDPRSPTAPYADHPPLAVIKDLNARLRETLVAHHAAMSSLSARTTSLTQTARSSFDVATAAHSLAASAEAAVSTALAEVSRARENASTALAQAVNTMNQAEVLSGDIERVEKETNVGKALEEAGKVVLWIEDVIGGWEEEERVQEEERARVEDEKRRVEEEKKRQIEDERRRNLEEEQRKLAEERRVKAEAAEKLRAETLQRRLEEERRRAAEAEQQRIAEEERVRKESEQRRAEEEEKQRLAEEAKKREERRLALLEANRQAAERRTLEQARAAEEARLKAEQEEEMRRAEEYRKRRAKAMQEKFRTHSQATSEHDVEAHVDAGLSPPSSTSSADVPLVSSLPSRSQSRAGSSTQEGRKQNAFVPATTEAGRHVVTDMPFSSIALASEKEKKVPAESASSIKRSASQRLTPIHIPPPSQHPVGAPTSSGSESAVSMDMGPLPVRHVTPAANLRHLRKENPAAPAGRQQSSPSGFAVQVNVKQEPTTPQPQNARVQSSSEPAPSQEPVANKSDSSRDAEPPAITPTRPKFPNFNKRKPGEANNEVFDDADLGATRREDHRMLSPISTSVPLPASNLTASPVTPTRDPRLRRDGSRPTVYNRDADLAQSPMDHTGDGGWSNSNGPMSAVSGDGGWPDHSQPSRGTTSQELGGRIDEQQRPNEPRLPTRPSNDTRWSPPPRRVSGGNRPQLPNKPARASDHYSPPPRPYSPPSSYAPPPRSAPLPRARTPPRALPASGRQQQYDHYAHAGPSSQVYSQARRLTPPGSPPPMSRKRPRSPDPRGPDFPSTQRRWSGQYEQPRVVSRGRTPPLPPTYRSRTPTPERRRPEPRFAAPPPIPPMRPPSPRGRTYAIGGGESYRPAYQSPERSYSPPNERPSYEETYRRPYDAPNPVNERMRPVASPPPPPAPRSAQPHLSFAKASDAEHPPKRPRVNRAKVQQAPVPARAPSPPPPPPQVERPVALLDRMSDYPITASTSGGGQNANRRGTERPPTQPRGGSQGRGRGGASRGGAAPRVSLAARLSGGESLQDRIGD